MLLVYYLILINIAAFIVYGADKSYAKKGARRIPEKTLLLWAFLGGSIGALLGMKVFHHKTLKPKFVCAGDSVHWFLPVLELPFGHQ